MAKAKVTDSDASESRNDGKPQDVVVLTQKQGGQFRQSELMDAKRVPLGAQEAMRQVGRIEAAAMIGRVTEAIETSSLKEIRDQRLFEQWGYESFKDFCERQLPLSYATYEERIQNMETFGGRFLDWADRVGLGVRVMRSLRRLEPGDIKAFVARVEAGQSSDNEMIAMAFEYQAEVEDRRAAEESARKARKDLENERTARKKAGDKLAEQSEEIKKLLQENRELRHPKDMTDDDRRAAIAEAHNLGSRALARIAALKLDPKTDVQLIAKAHGNLSELATAAERYAQMFAALLEAPEHVNG